jgi:hypothetical protein
MNPDYLWVTGAMQLLTFFVAAPILAIAIGYAVWQGKPQTFDRERYGMASVASGIATALLFAYAKHINADVRTAQYFLQLACALLSGLLFWHIHGVRRRRICVPAR